MPGFRVVKFTGNSDFYRMKRLFLDFASTTPLHPEVEAVMLDTFRNYPGNPSSIHEDGRRARFLIEESREKIASLLHKEPSEIIFTSSATESINTVLKSWFMRNLPGTSRFLTSPAEHHATLHTLKYLKEKGASVQVIQPDSDGIVSVFPVDSDTLVSLMAVNNELGSLLPSETVSTAQKAGALVHIDAVQALGKIRLDPFLSADFLSFSGHKFYGPRGTGLLVAKNGSELDPLLHGGAQERNRRSGTEATALIAGLTRALELALNNQESAYSEVYGLNRYLRQTLTAQWPAVTFNSPETGSPFILNFTLSTDPEEEIDSEALIMGLDAKGISVSSGSACSSGSWEPSHVLTAIGKTSYEAQTTLRVSFGPGLSREDLDRFTDTLVSLLIRMKASKNLI